MTDDVGLGALVKLVFHLNLLEKKCSNDELLLIVRWHGIYHAVLGSQALYEGGSPHGRIPPVTSLDVTETSLEAGPVQNFLQSFVRHIVLRIG